MIQKSLLTLFSAFVLFTAASAQNIIQSRTYPKNYFRYPLDIAPSTAGGFGELRPNHFHAGLDFRTNQQSGYPVHAAADGYVSRVRVQFGGGGNIVYITHPNGYTTVYMHNERFNPEITKALRAYQYEHQQFDVDMVLPAGQINVCKGDVISISGSSGAVAGPHLHFEIRDTQTEQTINPQLFGLTIPDAIAPAINSIAIYHLDDQPFSEKTKHEFLQVAGAHGHYHLVRQGAIPLSGNIGFGINTVDMNSASFNHNGVYSIELKLDGRTVYTFAMERFAFDQTHAINAYIDYPTHLQLGRFIQKCFILPGSKISIYPQSENRGIINFNDDNEHDVEYVVKDVAGNTSTLNLKVQSKHELPAPATTKSGTVLFRYDQKNDFDNGRVHLTVMPGNLYDNVDFVYSTSPMLPGCYSVVHRIHNKFTPIHDSYELWIKPDRDLGPLNNKAVILNTNGEAAPGTYQDGYVKAQVKNFGDYYIKVDTIPPHITPLDITNGKNMRALHRISFRIGDNLSGIKTYNGSIDGKWVLMEWDFKTKVLSYTFDKDFEPGKHNFELTVSDNKDNVSHYKAEFYK